MSGRIDSKIFHKLTHNKKNIIVGIIEHARNLLILKEKECSKLVSKVTLIYRNLFYREFPLYLKGWLAIEQIKKGQ